MMARAGMAAAAPDALPAEIERDADAIQLALRDFAARLDVRALPHTARQRMCRWFMTEAMLGFITAEERADVVRERHQVQDREQRPQRRAQGGHRG